jgi:hypothetical protein
MDVEVDQRRIHGDEEIAVGEAASRKHFSIAIRDGLDQGVFFDRPVVDVYLDL